MKPHASILLGNESNGIIILRFDRFLLTKCVHYFEVESILKKINVYY